MERIQSESDSGGNFPSSIHRWLHDTLILQVQNFLWSWSTCWSELEILFHVIPHCRQIWGRNWHHGCSTGLSVPLITLTKSILSNLLVYFLCLFQIPVGEANQLKKIQRNRSSVQRYDYQLPPHSITFHLVEAHNSTRGAWSFCQ